MDEDATVVEARSPRDELAHSDGSYEGGSEGDARARRKKYHKKRKGARRGSPMHARALPREFPDLMLDDMTNDPRTVTSVSLTSSLALSVTIFESQYVHANDFLCVHHTC